MEATTITALATAPYPSGLAVIRVSGPKTRKALKALFRGKKDPVLYPRQVCFGSIVDFKTGEEIDNALVFFMPNPHSFTGEDVGELQFHGSPLLVQKILRSLYSFGVVPAEPGEFTKRAFINGKLDLAQAEAIADLIHASTERALRIAGEQLKGSLSKEVQSLGEVLRDVLAEIEAHIDFPEEDIEPAAFAQLQKNTQEVYQRIEYLLKTFHYGQVLKEGFRVLLCGRPNVGKSSLLNLVLGRSRAIVSDISGTTRDLLEEEALLGGYKFVFCDSAGIRDTSDHVEKLGVELAREKISWADLVLLVVDATDTDGGWRKVLEELQGKSRKIWLIINKIDLNPQAIGTLYCDLNTCEHNFYISIKTKNGVEELVNALIDEVSHKLEASHDGSLVVTSERHRNCLVGAVDALERALSAFQLSQPLEIVSAEVRIALRSLEEIIGKTSTEDILGRIFSKFCIGK